MHERSIAMALLKQVEACVAAEGAARVAEIHVQLGPLAGVEPLLLRGAFEEVARKSIAAGAVLRLEEVALTARCLDCDSAFEVLQFRFRCPNCSSGKIRVIQGESVMLESIQVVDCAAAVAEESV